MSLGIGVGFVLYRRETALSGLTPPNQPEFGVTPGAGSGDISIEVTDLPDTWGDLVALNDGLGVAGILQWWNSYDGWTTLVDPAATGTFNMNVVPSLWGTTATIKVRGVSDGGNPGVEATATVAVPGVAQEFEIYTNDDGDPYTTDLGQAYYKI